MNNDVVMIRLDRERQLKFGHTALKTLVEITGKTMEELDRSLDVSNFEFLEQMIYCGLLKDARDSGETLTLENMPALLDEAPSYAHVLEKTMDAWYAAFGVKKPSEGNLPAPAEEPANGTVSTGKKASG